MSVTPSNTCGNGVVSTLAVTVTTAVPDQPSPINGNNSVCPGSIETYSVGNTGGVTYTWSVPSGWTINSGQNSSNIQVTAGNNSGSVQVIPSNGCGNGTARSFAVTVNPLPDVPAGSDVAICGSGTVTLNATANAGETIDWYAVSAGETPLQSNSTSFITPNISTTVTYYAEARNNTTGCVSASRKAVTAIVNTLPTVTFTTSPSGPVCANTDIVYTTQNNQTNYIWTFSGTAGTDYQIVSGGGTNNNTVTLRWLTPGSNKTVSVNYTNSNGCSGSSAATSNIMVNPATTIVNQPVSPAVICAGGGNRQLSVSAAGTGLSYQWQYSANGSSGWSDVVNNTPSNITYSGNTGTTLSITPGTNAATGVYYYRVRVNGSCGDPIFSDVVEFNVKALPAISSITGTTTICSGTATTLMAHSSATNPVFTWYNSASGGTALFTGTSYTTGNLSSNTSYWVTVSDENGCASSGRTPVSVTVNQPAGFSTHPADQTICAQSNTSFTSSATGTGVTYQWQVSTNGGSSWSNVNNGGIYSGATGNTLTLTNAPVSMSGYQYRVIANVNGCASATSNSAVLTVNPLPQITGISGSTSICAGTSTTLTASSNASTPSYTWYNQQAGGSSLGSAASFTTPALNNNTNYYIAVRDITTGCASASRTLQTVTVNAIPAKPAIHPSNITMCQGTVQSLFSGVVGGSFDYSGTNNSITNIPNNNSNGAYSRITIPAGTIPTNAQNIRIEVKFNIIEGRNQDLIINLKAPNGNALNLINNNGSGSNFNNTIVSSTGTASFSSSSAPYTGTYKADAAIGANAGTSGSGITSSTSQWNQLFSQLNGTWQLNVRDNSFWGSNGTLSDWSITIYYSVVGIEEAVTWSPHTDLFTDINATTPYTGQSLSTVYLQPSTSGNKTYTATATNSSGCSNSTDVPVNVIAGPTGTITASKSTICVGEGVTFTAPAGSAYTFYVDDVPVQGPSTSPTFNTSELAAGIHQVTVDVVNSNNCGSLIGPVTVTVVPLPTPSLTATKTTICPNEPITFTATGGTSYTFKVNGTQVQTNNSGIWTSSTLANNDLVSVDVKNASGCIATSDTLAITVNPLPVGTLSSSAGSPAEICAGSPITFTATALTGASYEFFVNGSSQGAASASNSFTSSAITNGQVVNVKVSYPSGCFVNFNPIPVTVNPLPTGIFKVTENSGTSNDNIICSGANITFTAPAGYINYKFYLNGTGTVLQDENSNIYSTNTLTDGDFIKVVVGSNKGCSAEFSSPAIDVVAPPAGTLTITENSGSGDNDNAICFGDAITLTATNGGPGHSYTFIVDGTSQQTGTNNEFIISGLTVGTHTISVNVQNSNNCISTYGPVDITVHALPSGTLVPKENSGTAPDDGIICTGALVNFTAPTGYNHYDFLLNGFTVQSSTNNVYANTSLVNGDKVTVSVRNNNGCVALLNEVTMVVNPLPIVAAITGPQEVCVDSHIELDNTSAGGSWTSSNTGVATVDENSGIVTGISAGTTIITYTVRNGNECTQSVTKTITVHALPVLTAITGSNSVCIGNTTTLSSALAGGIWISDNTSVATVDPSTGIVTGIADGTAVITYSVTNTNGCVRSVQTTINVHALPVVEPINGESQVCMNATINLSNSISGGEWKSSDMNVAMVNSSGMVTGTNPGTTMITYKVTNSFGCVTTVQKEVTVNPLPEPTLSGKNPICVGETETYTTQAGKENYTWNFTGGTLVSGGEVEDHTITITWTSNGTKSVFVNWTEPGTGCSAPTSVTISNGSISAPTLISGPDITCLNSEDVFTTQAGKEDYLWDVTGGTFVTNAGGNSITVTWNVPGNHTVKFNYAEPGGCNAATPFIQTVNVQPLPKAVISGSASVCESSAEPKITFTGSQGKAPYTFTYSINGGSPLTVTSVANAATVNVPTGTPGTYTYTLLHVADKNPNSCGQDQTGTAVVTVTPLPTAIIAGTTEVCMGATPSEVTFTGNTGTAPYTFRYRINGGAIQTVAATGNNVSISAPTASSGTFTYELVDVTDANGCTNQQTGSAVITVNPLPTATVSVSENEVCIGGTSPILTFTGSDGTANYTFTYTINGGTAQTIISSGNSATIQVQTGTAGSFTYALVSVRDQSATTCSNDVSGMETIIIHPASAGGTVNGGATVCSGTNSGTLTLSGQVGNVVRWEYSTDGGSNWTAVSNTTTTLTFSNIIQTRQYRAIVQSGNCSPEASAAATIHVDAPSAGGTIAGSSTVCSGNNSGNLILSGNTGQVMGWESSIDGGITWTNINNTTTTFTYNNLTITTQYRARIKNGVCGITTSAIATITVNPLPEAGITGGTSVCMNADQPVITFTGTNGTAPYTFSYRINSGAVQTVVSTGNVATVQVPTSTAGAFTYSLVSVKDASTTTCAQNQTGSAVVTINTLPEILGNVTAEPATICLGSSSHLFIPAGTTTLISEDFEGTNYSFSIVNTGPTDNGSEWQVRSSTYNYYYGCFFIFCDLEKFNSGSKFALSISNEYTNTNTSLVSQPFSTMGYSSLNLAYRTYYRNPGSPETAVVEVSRNGSTWETVKSYTDEGQTVGTGNNFASETIDLSSYINEPKLQIRFRYSVKNDWYWAIDDIKVTGNQSVDGNIFWTSTSPSAGLPASAATPSESNSSIVVKPTAAGSHTYTVNLINANGCTASKDVTLIVNPLPTVSVTADYCIEPNKVRLTANAEPSEGVSYLWNTGETTRTIDVNVAGEYIVTVTNSTGCSQRASIGVAQELVTNGDFENGDDGSFATLYKSATGNFYNGNATSGLYPEGNYAIDTSVFSPANGVGYHRDLHGKDHTTGSGKYMMVNGSPDKRTIWSQVIDVLPNTTYYFSAWGMNLHPANPAELQFAVDDDKVGSVGELDSAPKPTGESDVNVGNWIQFYGNWTSGPATTRVTISIINLNLTESGNDFGLDDISFSTLSPFIRLVSDPGTDAQVLCLNTPITPIVYLVGSTSAAPTISPALPAGLTSTFDGQFLRITGTPTVAGHFSYTVSTTANGTCGTSTASGSITVKEQTINLATGDASPSLCKESPLNIVFTLGGTATDATTSGLPEGVSGTVSGNTFTISGTPDSGVEAGTYPYTITTSGECTPATFTGIITLEEQKITLYSGEADQTGICIHSPISSITYQLEGKATGATVEGLPDGVSYLLNSGFLVIQGSPTEAGSFTYSITTTGDCVSSTTSGTIEVLPAATIGITKGNSTVTSCINTAIPEIEYTPGNATEAMVTGLPEGLTGVMNGGKLVISGSPTESGTFTYTVTTTDGCGTASVDGTLIIEEQTLELTNGSLSQSVCKNAPISNIEITFGGSATSAEVTSLPAGVGYTVSGNVITIHGAPTEGTGSYPYQVITTGNCSVKLLEGTITINPSAVGGTISSPIPPVCGGTSSSITLTGNVGNIIRWESSTDGGSHWTNISNTTITLSYPAIQQPTLYRAVTQTSCGMAYSSVADVKVRNYWIGSASPDWNDGANWSDGNVPTIGCANVYVPNTANQPVINTSVPAIENLYILTGATLTLTNTGYLKIAGSISSTGALDARHGTLEFNGSAVQQISAGMFKDTTIANLRVSNAAGLEVVSDAGNQTLSVTDMISFDPDKGKLDGKGHVTLKSTYDKTASLGEVGANNTVTGDFIVERYINSGTDVNKNQHGKKWLFLATPTGHDGNGQTIRQSWMENGSTPPNFGTYLTGPEGTAGGWDASSPSPAIKTYNMGNYDANLWVRALSANNKLYNQHGWMTFIRGDRTKTTVDAVANETTLRSKGSLRTGTITYSIPPSATAFYPIGNPYASAIDMRKVPGITHFYVWDPNATGLPGDPSYGLGAYITYTRVGSDFSAVGAVTGTNNYILSGQAFFLQPDESNTINITINEKSKGITNQNVTFFRGGNTSSGNTPVLKTNLYNQEKLEDGTLHIFDEEYSNEVDQDDARKMLNSGINLSIRVKDKLLVVERRKFLAAEDTIFYNLTGLTNGRYRFEIAAENLWTPGMEAWLEDSFTGGRTPLNMDSDNEVEFEITAATSSKAADRFRIVFKNPEAAPLPVTFMQVNASRDGDQVIVDWTVAQEVNLDKYIVMKSDDGVNFKQMSDVKARGADTYRATDTRPVDGYNYYRIRSVAKDGHESYSDIVKVFVGWKEPKLSVFPNPVKEGIINLRMENYPSGKYLIRLLNPAGQLMLAKQFTHTGGGHTEKIPWDYKMTHGTYHLEVVHPDGSLKVIVIMY